LIKQVTSLDIVSLLIALFVVVIYLTGSLQIQKTGEVVLAIALFIFFGLVGVYSLFESKFTKGRYDEDSISFASLWTGKKEERWDDLISVNYNSVMNCYELKFKSGSVIRLSSYLLGHQGVIDILGRKGK